MGHLLEQAMSGRIVADLADRKDPHCDRWLCRLEHRGDVVGYDVQLAVVPDVNHAPGTAFVSPEGVIPFEFEEKAGADSPDANEELVRSGQR